MEKEHLSPARIKAIRTLDVEFAMEFARQNGTPFHDTTSEVTGAPMRVEEVALMALHQLRFRIGTKTERRASESWLLSRGFPRFPYDPKVYGH